VSGQWTDGVFRDRYAHSRLAPLPVCYRVRPRKKQYHLMNHNFNFWSESFFDAEKSEESSEPPPVESPQPRKPPLEKQPEPECMVCLSRPPRFVFQACRHYGVCAHCRTWMCKSQFNASKTPRCQESLATLKTEKVRNVAIKCPICRQVTRVVHSDQYKGLKILV
jgi:hypothetical protein